jgi:hypothetical protein
LERVFGVLVDDGAAEFVDGCGGSEDPFVDQGDGFGVGELNPVWVEGAVAGPEIAEAWVAWPVRLVLIVESGVEARLPVW